MPLLVQVLVAAVVLGLLYWLVQALPLPEPFSKVARAAVLLAAIVWLLTASGLAPRGLGLW